MNRGRIARVLSRGAVISWREQPTQYDIEALRANIERVGLVIRLRWAIIGALAAFSVVGAFIYATSVDFVTFRQNMVVPAVAIVFVAAYNAYYQLTYRRLGNLAFLNQAQLLFDILVATVLVYYSGGVYSWFSAMYLLFILEGAFILPKRGQVWMLAAVSALLYGAVLFGEYLGVLPHVEMPFVRNELHHNHTFVLVRYLWFVTLYAGVAIVGLLMMRSIREREEELKETSFIDDLTGLFNRQYFQRVLVTEVERARRNGRGVALVVADLYRLSEINRTFGVDVGDALVAAFADQARHAAAADAAEVGFEVCVGARVGGEEIALIVPDISPGADAEIPLEQRALAIAERLRAGMEGVLAHGVGAVASVGVALFPRDAHTADELFDAADAMLASASEAGGNCVRVTWVDGECLRGEE